MARENIDRSIDRSIVDSRLITRKRPPLIISFVSKYFPAVNYRPTNRNGIRSISAGVNAVKRGEPAGVIIHRDNSSF